MSRAHVLLLENIHVSAHEEFRRSGIAVHTHGGGMSDDRLIEALRALPGEAPLMVGIRSKTRVSAAVFEAVPRLVALGAFCIGTDQIDLEAARRAGVVVFNAPFSNTRSVAELVLGEIIMLSRQIFPRSAACHRGEWRKSASGSHEVRGKTVGIVGYGHIGSQLSVLAESLGLTVLYYDIVSKLPLGNAHPVDSLEGLLAASDFVTLHVPDTELTRGMIGEREIRCMRKGAYLVNASRGQVVDIPALRAALDDDHLAGAAIDVYPKEPKSLSETFVSELRGVESVILTPHIGGSTEEAQANIGREVGSALSSYLLHGATTGSVNIPNLEAPPLDGGCRIVNLHRNVPGVLSAVNRVVAESEVNVTGQRLGTLADVGLLIVDLAIDSSDPRARAVSEAIAALPTSLRTRIL
ncbi:MAG: phosphoglycerate dehydrogenase [Nannocystaceae bacterium]